LSLRGHHFHVIYDAVTITLNAVLQQGIAITIPLGRIHSMTISGTKKARDLRHHHFDTLVEGPHVYYQSPAIRSTPYANPLRVNCLLPGNPGNSIPVIFNLLKREQLVTRFAFTISKKTVVEEQRDKTSSDKEFGDIGEGLFLHTRESMSHDYCR